MLTMFGFLLIFALTFHENIKADNINVGSKDTSIFVPLKPRNLSNHVVDNATKTNIHTSVKRRAVLILNGDPALRSVQDKKNVTSLYYQDYDDNGNVLNTMWMYNLRDVAEFFKIFLDTQVCYGRCEK